MRLLRDMKSRKTKPQVGLYRPDSPYSEEECEAIIQKLELFLDGQLKGKDKEEVERLIRECAYCAEQYSFERRLRELLARSWRSVSADVQEVVTRVRRRIWGSSAE
jgi:anti-sigma factor (TIGR02949 family)